MKLSWTKYNKEQAQEVLTKISHLRDAVVFSRDVTEVSFCRMPFYTNYWLYRLVNYATLPTFSMIYLSNGEEFIPLDGTSAPIYTVNEQDPLHLNENTVTDYVDFFFSHMQGSEGEILMIKDPKSLPFLSSLSPAQQQALSTHFRPPEGSRKETGFEVACTLYYGGGILSAVIHVQPDGKLAFLEQNLLFSGIHYPHNPYLPMWAER